MEILFITVGLIINGIVANIIGNLGKEKKIGYWTSFWVSFLLTPILGVLLVIASRPITEIEKEENKKLNVGSESVKDFIFENKKLVLTPEELQKLKKKEDITIFVIAMIALSFIIYTIIK